MKLSLNWLKDFVELPADLTSEKLAYDLTMATVEVEGCEDRSTAFEKMTVGKVLSVKPHPDADRLRICDVELRKGEVKEIVCGGSNLTEGMLVAVAEPGAKVRWHGEGELVELGLAKIRGVQSYGMICASNEIGLGELFPLKDEKEIVDLSHLNLPVGSPLAEALELDDIIIEIDNKSLTNRPDLWGHYGMARELSAIYNTPLKPLPSFELPSEAGGVQIQIDDPKLCKRFSCALIENIRVEPSPLWMQVRLASVGQRPINLMVDLSNYVMFAVGQPNHAFDAEKVADRTLHIRAAEEKEALPLLDGTELTLSNGALVVADKKSPLSLAGIMGGRDSGVNDGTTSLLFETATWDPIHIRRNATRFGVRTDSSMRFEKGLDTARTDQATMLFLTLLKDIQPEMTVGGWVDEHPTPDERISVSVGRAFLNGRIGRDSSMDEITTLLTGLGFTVSASGENLTVGVPPWRATGDVSIPEDIVEEVARMIGYDNIAFVAPSIILDKALKQPHVSLDRDIRTFLAKESGMFELSCYPWIEEKFAEAAGCANENDLALCDAPSPTSTTLKTSLIPDLLFAAERNVRNNTEFSAFEVARVFNPHKWVEWTIEDEKLPDSPKMCAGMCVAEDSKDAFLSLKGILERLFDSLPIQSYSLDPIESGSAWTTKGATLSISVNDNQIGELSLASRKVKRKAEIERGELALFEFNLSAITPQSTKDSRFQPLPKYPQVNYDLALLFDMETPWRNIESVVKQCDPFIRSVFFSDEYRGEQIPDGKKSVAFQMVLGDPESTLTSEQAQTIADKVLTKIESELGGKLRDR